MEEPKILISDIAEIINKQPLPEEGHKWDWANELAWDIYKYLYDEDKPK